MFQDAPPESLPPPSSRAAAGPPGRASSFLLSLCGGRVAVDYTGSFEGGVAPPTCCRHPASSLASGPCRLICSWLSRSCSLQDTLSFRWLRPRWGSKGVCSAACSAVSLPPAPRLPWESGVLPPGGGRPVGRCPACPPPGRTTCCPRGPPPRGAEAPWGRDPRSHGAGRARGSRRGEQRRAEGGPGLEQGGQTRPGSRACQGGKGQARGQRVAQGAERSARDGLGSNRGTCWALQRLFTERGPESSCL